MTKGEIVIEVEPPLGNATSAIPLPGKENAGADPVGTVIWRGLENAVEPEVPESGMAYVPGAMLEAEKLNTVPVDGMENGCGVLSVIPAGRGPTVAVGVALVPPSVVVSAIEKLVLG